MIKRTPALAAALAALAAVSGPISASASPPPPALNCPNVAAFDLSAARELDAAAVREIAPSAGSNMSAELASYAALSMASYEMYDAFDRGEDPETLLPPGLQPVALIYGDPGRDTERLGARRRRDTSTFYGFIADEVATGRRFVVLRGTLQPNEWLRNLQLRQRPYPAGERRWRAQAWVHNGFLEIFESLTFESHGVETPLSPALPEIVFDRDVVVIGHSLGGALATLVGVEAARRSPDDAERLDVITFGSPRVGDPGFAEMAGAVGRIVRVCNLTDAVPAVPPNTPRRTYTHVGEIFRVSSFDWPRLDNDLRTGQQILCWHSIYAYRYMTDPEKTEFPELEDCLAPE